MGGDILYKKKINQIIKIAVLAILNIDPMPGRSATIPGPISNVTVCNN
tara:strand:- start:1555 stop:1698 length:144 start_codon:yes stop_codon:yes gene_type:complete